MSKTEYKRELVETLAPTLEGLNWFQIAMLLEQIDQLVEEYSNV